MQVRITIVDKTIPAPLAIKPVEIVLDTNNPDHIERLAELGYKAAPYPKTATITIRNK